MFSLLKRQLHRMTIFFVLVPFFAMGASPLPQAPVSSPYNVAFFYKPNAPILTDIAIEVWSETATVLNQKYTLVKAASEQEALQWLQQKKVNVVIGPLKLNEYYPGVDFINSYIHNAIGIVVLHNVRISFFDMLKDYFEALFGVTVIGILIMIVIFGILIWLVERKKNSGMYSLSPLKGIGDSIWNCLVTFATVGYGDVVPKTLLGRIIAGFWIILSLLLVSVFVASITSELTYMKTKIANLTSLSQLYDQKVAIMRDDLGALTMANRYHIRSVMVDNLAGVIYAVTHKQVVAGFANIYSLGFYMSQHPNLNVILTPYQLNLGNYAFALRNDDPLQPRLTRILYAFSEVDKIGEKVGRFMGPLHMEKKG